MNVKLARSLSARSLPLVSLTVLFSCSQVPQDVPETRTVGQMLRASQTPAGDAALSFDILMTDQGNGPAVKCTDGQLDVTIEVSTDHGKHYKKVSTEGLDIACENSGGPDVALVVDNSGSESGYLDDLRSASESLARVVTAAGGRMSLVRVSTETSVLSDLNSDPEKLVSMLPELHVHRGWTALYDGIRVGNETLGAAVVAEDTEKDHSKAGFCGTQPRRAIVVFTDGNDNNSSDEHSTANYPGDGINTTLEDVNNLKVRGVTTPIYSIGLGKDVDHQTLHDLAEHSGGKHHQIEEPKAIQEIFDHIAGYTGPRLHVCGSLPTTKCGRMDVRLKYKWNGKNAALEGGQDSTIDVACADTTPVQPARTATVMMSLTDSGIKKNDGADIAARTVAWVSPTAKPEVLVVLDDNHHGEALGDPPFIVESLQKAGYSVTFQDEPEFGLETSDLEDYDVVWFSNPGYPMDDELTFNSLREVAGNGVGVVLQGDDMGWSWGGSFDMSPLTHLTFQDNGTGACGYGTDNDGGNGLYRVTLENDKVFWGNAAGKSMSYGDDIDQTTVKNEGESVLAWATVQDGKGKPIKGCDLKVPVVVAYDPANAK